jgi:hypothetical protein
MYGYEFEYEYVLVSENPIWDDQDLGSYPNMSEAKRAIDTLFNLKRHTFDTLDEWHYFAGQHPARNADSDTEFHRLGLKVERRRRH